MTHITERSYYALYHGALHVLIEENVFNRRKRNGIEENFSTDDFGFLNVIDEEVVVLDNSS